MHANSHYPGARINDIENGENSKKYRERSKERQEQERVEQGISLLYTPCLF